MSPQTCSFCAHKFTPATTAPNEREEGDREDRISRFARERDEALAEIARLTAERDLLMLAVATANRVLHKIGAERDEAAAKAREEERAAVVAWLDEEAYITAADAIRMGVHLVTP